VKHEGKGGDGGGGTGIEAHVNDEGKVLEVSILRGDQLKNQLLTLELLL